jgi:bifunctional DNA-binding transcriptional regulator/antitoxin component of YhaV-PrlF toxin-antitoxin module
VTSKLQVTIPKLIAERYGIAPGEEIDWLPAGDAIRVVPKASGRQVPDVRGRRLQLFDRATDRQRARQSSEGETTSPPMERGWRREDLYERGVTD